jgi:septum site-determining protein MinC
MNEPTAGSREPRVEVRFGPVGLAQVRIRTTDPAVVEADLAGRVATAPKMFDRMPVALDLNELDRAPDRDALHRVLDAVRRAGLIPIGFARGTEAIDVLARELEMPVLMQFRASKRGAAEARADDPDGDVPVPAAQAAPPAPASPAAPAAPAAAAKRAPAPGRARPAAPEPAVAPLPTAGAPVTPAAARAEAPPEAGPSLLHVQTVRSGQRVYARNRDLVVTATVGAGAEVMADGCVHVYGSLRGRAMAGTRGDTAARVFCQEFHAELVSIAGVFRVFETIPPELDGQPVQAWLDGEDLRFARIG